MVGFSMRDGLFFLIFVFPGELFCSLFSFFWIGQLQPVLYFVIIEEFRSRDRGYVDYLDRAFAADAVV